MCVGIARFSLNRASLLVSELLFACSINIMCPSSAYSSLSYCESGC